MKKKAKINNNNNNKYNENWISNFVVIILMTNMIISQLLKEKLNLQN